MAASATVMHILPGKTREFLDFACDLREGRLQDHKASRHNLGITTERVWIETTNSGDVLIFYLEGDKLERSFKLLAESREPYDLWYKERMRAITGVDLNHPEAVTLAELVLESPEFVSDHPVNRVATVFPILPGLKNEWRQWIDELVVARQDEYRGYLWRYGLRRERFFLQAGPGGNLVILYAEGEDPAGSIARFARSHHPFDIWMREEMLFLNGIDFIRRASAPRPDLVFEWAAEPGRVAA